MYKDFLAIKYSLVGICCLLLLAYCVPPSDNKDTSGTDFDLEDKTLQLIYNLQDRQRTDSLVAYFSHENPTYRKVAVLAMGSIKDTAVLPALINALQDPAESVQLAAAFSLGQLGTPGAEAALVKAFANRDSLMRRQPYNAAILEALGKCGTLPTLKQIANVSTYTRADTALLTGQATSIYRFGVRGITAPEGTAKMLTMATDPSYPHLTRRIAAHYLARVKDLNLSTDSMTHKLLQAYQRETNMLVKLPLAAALGKTKNLLALSALSSHYQTATDYRLQVYLLNALSTLPYDTVKTLFYTALDHKNTHVAATAGQFFLEHGVAKESGNYWAKAKEPRHWQVQLSLYGAALRYMSNTFLEYKQMMSNELKTRLTTSKNFYEQAAIIRTLGEFGWNYPSIRQLSYNSNIPVIRTAGVETLAAIAADPNFFLKFRESSNAVKKQLRDYLVEAVVNADVGMSATAAMALRDEKAGFKPYIADSLFAQALVTTQQKLKLPRDIETYNELQKTIDYYKNTNTPPKKLAYNHPIDWLVYFTLEDSAKAVVKTTKGDITILLLPEVAPGSVANFVKLARANFYNGKPFHRVVSNFVVQTGCPRGDGFGNLDYSIRSELSPLPYEEGYVGMASAGNHTEASQWFITHVPTPHLEGNYTIFGKVIGGMSVVHALEIGDAVQKVTLVEK